MRKYTLYIIAAFAVIFIASSCDKTRRGVIEGTISEAEGRLLTLEHLSEGNPRRVDTVRLDAAGKFKFTPEVEAGPDFFSLHLDNNQSVSVVIDTLLTPVTVTAKAATLANGYEVVDDLNKELKSAILCGNRLRTQIRDLSVAVNNKSLTAEEGRDSMAVLVENYKSYVLETYLYTNPASPASYYLLHESVGGLIVFDPNDHFDNRAFGAVATSWMAVYPNSPRTKALEQKALDGQRLRYAQRKHEAERDSIFMSKVVETNYPVLNLRNADDHAVSLSSLDDNNSVILLDFTAYALNVSPAHNIALSELYEKYAAKGLKIYQVCLDYDENFWKTSADNLPWTTVRDEEVLLDQYGNIQYSPAAALYNVQTLPVCFIIGKDGELKGRVEDDSKLETEIRKQLK